jgi:adenylate cyclase
MQPPRSVEEARIQERASTLLEWLASDDCHELDGGEFIAALGALLAKSGIPIHHLAVHIRALNPTLFGRSIVWKRGEPVIMRDLLHGEERLKHVQEGPLGHVTAKRKWLVLRPHDQRWAALAGLPLSGLSELCIAPMVHGPGESANAVSFGTRSRQGFQVDHLDLFRRILPALRNAVELKIWPRMTAAILDAYIGADPEKHVLSGRIRRGDVETIEAAIMFCDLHGFTQLSNRLSSERVLALLNTYFDQVVPSVTERGGEVLKFMGDGLLAVFRVDGSAERTCAIALDTAQTICRRLQAVTKADLEIRAGIGLHFGKVSYGNIGSGQRLDFTVIGRDVNLASRIQGQCGPLSEPVLLSPRFAALADFKSTSVGRHALKGFDEPVELFAPGGA